MLKVSVSVYVHRKAEQLVFRFLIALKIRTTSYKADEFPTDHPFPFFFPSIFFFLLYLQQW